MKLSNQKTKAAADWILEVSALVLVFPFLDSIVHPTGVPGWLPWAGVVIGLGGFGIGVYFTPEKDKS